MSRFAFPSADQVKVQAATQRLLQAVRADDADALGTAMTDMMGAMQPGMELRDYFAAKALQGLAARLLESDVHELSMEIRGGLTEARIAYQLADAMLKAREQS